MLSSVFLLIVSKKALPFQHVNTAMGYTYFPVDALGVDSGCLFKRKTAIHVLSLVGKTTHFAI